MSTQKTNHKIVLLGDIGVGKTCLMSRFIFGTFDANENSTKGACYSNKEKGYPNFGKILNYYKKRIFW